MKVALDAASCVGHGRCYAVAPDVFDADDRGHCVLRFDGSAGDEIPPDLVEQARHGVQNCPEDALTLTE